MNILIINLPRYQGLSVTREGRCEFVCNYRVDTPATLLIIASLLRDLNYQIEFIDANALNYDCNYVEMLLETKNYDCVIFTFNSWIIDYELRICDVIKRINQTCKTIGYSWFAENFGVQILSKYKNLDIQIINDPFSVIENLIDFIKNGRNLSKVDGIAFRDNKNEIIVNQKLENRRKFNSLPLPAYDLLTSFKPYYLYSPLLKPYALIYAGNGCPFSCTYCTKANTQYSGRSADVIIKELRILKNLANLKYIWFYDEIFTINRKRVIEVCNNIIEEKLRIKWFCDSRVDLVDRRLLNLMKDAGCIGISYGVESGSSKILGAMKKNISINQAKNALKWTREARIPIQLNLILGYIGENEVTLRETEHFVNLTLPEILQIAIIIAMNGTEFTNLAKKNNWICENLSWNEKITDLRLDEDRYEPFKINFAKETKKLYRILYKNPKWWLNSLKTLMSNFELIIPTLGILLYRFKSINLF